MLEAIHGGDRPRVDAIMAEIANRHGLTSIGDAPMVPFDATTHKPMPGSKQPAPGAMVHVVRPGYRYNRDGEDILLAKAVVEEATPGEIAAHKAAAVPGSVSASTVEPTGNAVSGNRKPRMVSRGEAQQMQDKMTADSPWTPRQHAALQDYSANEYLLMNSRLRGTVPRAFDQNITDDDPVATEQRIRDVDAALRPLPEPVRVFRNAYSAEGLGLPKSYTRAELIARLGTLVGETREDKGFTSTSLKRLANNRFGDVRLDIDVPAGTRGAFIETLTAKKHENELILAPGLRFEILSLDGGGSMPVLKVRVVPA